MAARNIIANATDTYDAMADGSGGPLNSKQVSFRYDDTRINHSNALILFRRMREKLVELDSGRTP